MASQVLNIIRGSDREFTIRVTLANGCADGEPFDLSGAAEIKILLRKDDDTILTKTMTGGSISILSACAGKVKVTLTDADTSSLKVGDAQSFEIEIQVGSITSIVQFTELLNVINRVFAA